MRAGETSCDWQSAPAYVWNHGKVRALAHIDAPDWSALRGIEKQKAATLANLTRHASGYAAHDMLLWGARGMGKSALLRSAVKQVQQAQSGNPALVQIAANALATLPDLFDELGDEDRPFVIFIDDLGFAEGDLAGPRQLRSWLDGGVEARPANCRIAVTSNRRALLARHTSEQNDPLNPRDEMDDMLALADRFGLSLGFHPCDQDTYLEIVGAYAEPLGLAFETGEALQWAKQRGQRSGRTAWHYVVELAGRAGKPAR